MKAHTVRPQQWLVTLKHFGNGKTQTVTLPGGLHEPEALRGAVLKAGPYWRVVRAEKVAV